jgi:hypothetical protein
MGWLLQLLGIDNGSGTAYLFWSGFGADLPIFAGIVLLYWRHTCHVEGCWRIARRKVPGTEHVVCGRHHPQAIPTHQQVLDDHAASGT